MNVSVGTWLAQQKTKVLARTNSRNASLTPAVLHNYACGGGGGDSSGDNSLDPDRGNTGDNINTDNPINEDRTRPASGSFSSTMTPVKDNGANPFPNEGPQEVNINRVVAWPGLRFGDFLVTNNPWNASAGTYENWYQDISLISSGDNVQAVIDWGLGCLCRYSWFIV